MTSLRYAFVFLLSLTLLFSASSSVQAGTQWVPNSGNPILSPGKLGSWDYGGVIRPRVVYDGHEFRMWYSGLDSGGNLAGIGYATSADGVTWVNSGPVLTASATNWEGSYISIGSVIWTGSEFVMYYRGVGGQAGSASSHGAVGIATSPDGVTWTKYSNNPVMTTGGPDADFLSAPYVLQTGTSYQMWYSCKNAALAHYGICYATSGDGKTWTKNPSAVLVSAGFGAEAGDLYSPSVLYDGTTYGMWYTMADAKGVKTQIGYASSKDGITWNKDPNNPILPYGPSGSWDGNNVENQCAVQYQQGFLLYYNGWSESSSSQAFIGVAQSPPDFTLSG